MEPVLLLSSRFREMRLARKPPGYSCGTSRNTLFQVSNNARSTWCLLRKLSPPCTACGGEGGAGHFPAADGSETSPARVAWGLVGSAVGSLVSVCVDRCRRTYLQPRGSQPDPRLRRRH